MARVVWRGWVGGRVDEGVGEGVVDEVDVANIVIDSCNDICTCR